MGRQTPEKQRHSGHGLSFSVLWLVEDATVHSEDLPEGHRAVRPHTEGQSVAVKEVNDWPKVLWLGTWNLPASTAAEVPAVVEQVRLLSRNFHPQKPV